jgi:hypothetical protein
MSTIHSTDPDFRVCRIKFETLIELQLEAESRGWGTRWTSVEALRRQVRNDDVLLRSFMREKWSGALRSYRCLVLFAAAGDAHGGGVVTIDIDPGRLESLNRLDRDPDVRAAFVRVFDLAMSGTSMLSKE